MQRHLNTSVLPEWAESRGGGGARGGSGENAVWTNNKRKRDILHRFRRHSGYGLAFSADAS